MRAVDHRGTHGQQSGHTPPEHGRRPFQRLSGRALNAEAEFGVADRLVRTPEREVSAGGAEFGLIWGRVLVGLHPPTLALPSLLS